MYYEVCLLYLLQRHVSAFNGHHQVVYASVIKHRILDIRYYNLPISSHTTTCQLIGTS